MTTFGEISYNDDTYADKKPGAGKDLFLRLKEGENEVRLLTNPFQYMVHKVKKNPKDPKDFGKKVNCSAIHGECSACAHDKAKARWLYGVISRDSGKYQILDVSWAVFSDIKKLAKGARFGDPTKYDITIIVDKNGGATGYYSVQALPKEPLSAADQKIKDNDLDLDDLKRRVTPPTPDVVQKKLDAIFGDDESAQAAAAASSLTKKTPAKPAKVASVSMTDDEEVSEGFPDYDGQS